MRESKGGELGMRSVSVHFLSFSCSFRQKYQICVPTSLAPPPLTFVGKLDPRKGGNKNISCPKNYLNSAFSVQKHCGKVSGLIAKILNLLHNHQTKYRRKKPTGSSWTHKVITKIVLLCRACNFEAHFLQEHGKQSRKLQLNMSINVETVSHLFFPFA